MTRMECIQIHCDLQIVDRKIRQCEMILKNRDESEATVKDAIVWLEQKEDVLASCLPLDMDPEMIDHATDKHKVRTNIEWNLT